MIHIYHGDGKGKTTAAFGLALRAIGAGRNVFVVQFLKKEGSSESRILEPFSNQVYIKKPDHFFGFTFRMTEEEKAILRDDYKNVLKELESWITEQGEQECLCILDEAIHACNHKILDETCLISLLEHTKQCKDKVELVLTGRNPSKELLATADYVTEMKKEKHPYDFGVKARKGIEY